MKKSKTIFFVFALVITVAGCKTTQVTTVTPAPPAEVINYTGLDLSSMVFSDKSLPVTRVRAGLKNMVRDILQDEITDGFYVKISGSVPDIAGELLAEAMLVKPYLVTGIVWTDDNARLAAMKCLDEGSADFVISADDIHEIQKDGPLERTKMPRYPKKVQPSQVVELDLSELYSDNPAGRAVSINNGAINAITDAEGKVSFIIPKSDTIRLAPCPMPLAISDWFLPFIYTVQPDGKVTRKSPWVEFRFMPELKTGSAENGILCKTDYPATVRINGDSLKQYKTGIFFKTVTFNEGRNRVNASVITPDSQKAFYECEFIYEKSDRTRKPYPLWIDRRSPEPAFDLQLLPEDVVNVSFRGSPGQEGYVDLKPGKVTVRCVSDDIQGASVYSASIPLRNLVPGKEYTLSFRLVPPAGAPVKEPFISEVHRTIIVRQMEDFPLLKVKNEYSRLTYDLGAPRLGGPIRQELGPGVLLKASGKFGDNYRVRLSNTESGYINKDDVELMPAGSVQPSYYITSMTCGPAKGADVLTIPWPEPVPYEVYPDPDQKRLVITLFGVETASTWVTHRTGREIIDRVTWDQPTPETYRIYVNLNTSKIWGYDIKPSGRSLVFRVKYPPVYDLNNEQPLTGLKVAIEAGHGGSNSGAIGLSGLVEKDINLDLSFRLGDLLRSKGAEVIQVRDSDKDMLLLDKRNIAVTSGADILISIHANAGGRGYLSTGGTSTYWHNPFWAPLAQSVYDRLLETGLAEFGVVGSFNYTVTRVWQMPAILVEQAFMTNAEDEERLADPLFRQLEAEKIYQGIVDYLKYMEQ
jgi:N-acetylmuramoyl-L-alanine amidase